MIQDFYLRVYTIILGTYGKKSVSIKTNLVLLMTNASFLRQAHLEVLSLGSDDVYLIFYPYFFSLVYLSSLA